MITSMSYISINTNPKAITLGQMIEYILLINNDQNVCFCNQGGRNSKWQFFQQKSNIFVY